MKAIVWTRYGDPDVLELQDIDKPVPGDHDVLIRVHATTVTAGDCELRGMGNPIWYRIPLRAYIGFRRPKRVTILGMELAGGIESAGSAVTRFSQGDQVFAATGLVNMGACVEYICLPEVPTDGALAAKPANMSHDEAAAVPVGGLEALHFLRAAAIRSEERILINGAGGTIGTFAVQLARHFGAAVTAVDSGPKLQMLRSIGAEQVIDYTQQDFTNSGEIYDVIFDVAGNLSFSRAVRSLKPRGRYLIANPRPSTMIRGRWTSMVSNKKVILGVASPKTEDLVFLKELIEAGKLNTVIDRRFPLEQAAEAHRYVETGQKIGNVIITVHEQGEDA